MAEAREREREKSARGLCNQREKCKFAPTCAYQKSNSSPSPAAHVYLSFETKRNSHIRDWKMSDGDSWLILRPIPRGHHSVLFSVRAACVFVCLLPRASYLMREKEVSSSRRPMAVVSFASAGLPEVLARQPPDDRPFAVYTICALASILGFYPDEMCPILSLLLACWLRVSATAACTRGWERWKMDFSTAHPKWEHRVVFCSKNGSIAQIVLSFWVCFFPDCE